MDPNDMIFVTRYLEAIDSSSSSEEDDDLIFLESVVNEVCATEVHAKIRRYVDDVVSQYSDADFRKHFRLERATVSQLTTMFETSRFCPAHERTQGGGTEIFPAEDYILVFLWFAGNKTTYRDVADRFGIAESTVFNIINIVMDFLIDIAPNIIKFPTTTAEKETLAEEFFQLAGVPDVLACGDGSYISTYKPAHKIRSTYINRHDGISVTLQGFVDAHKRFLDVFTGVPSKIHDSRVYKLSPISTRLQTICENRFHVLGDGAYELREWFLTPFRAFELNSRARRRYNRRFCATRVVVENAFGILKKRFNQLLRLCMWDVDRITKFIIACCVLHNICIDANDDVPEDGNDDSADDNGNDGDEEDRNLDDSITARQMSLRGELKRNDVCAMLQ